MRQTFPSSALLYLMLFGLLLTPLRLYAVQGASTGSEPPPCSMATMQGMDSMPVDHCGSVVDCTACVSCPNCLHAPAMSLTGGAIPALDNAGSVWTVESVAHLALRYLSPDTPPPRHLL